MWAIFLLPESRKSIVVQYNVSVNLVYLEYVNEGEVMHLVKAKLTQASMSPSPHLLHTVYHSENRGIVKGHTH